MMSNHLIRTCLFAPINRGQKRQEHLETKLASRSDVQLFYSGTQLDEADRDVFLQLVYEARKQALGEPVRISEARLLSALGKTRGGKDYDWLRDTIRRLHRATIVVEHDQYRIGTRRRPECGLHLIDRYDRDSDGAYCFTLDPRILTLFSRHEYSFIDWNIRLRLRTNIGKWLQPLVASSSNTIHRYSLNDLKEWMSYQGRERDFITALKSGLADLEREYVVLSPTVAKKGNGQIIVSWTRPPSKTKNGIRPSQAYLSAMPGQLSKDELLAIARQDLGPNADLPSVEKWAGELKGRLRNRGKQTTG